MKTPTSKLPTTEFGGDSSPRERESSWRSDGLKTKVSSHAFYFPSLDFNLGSVIVFLQFFV